MSSGLTLGQLLDQLDDLTEKVETVAGGIEKKAFLSREVLIEDSYYFKYKVLNVRHNDDRQAVITIAEA